MSTIKSFATVITENEESYFDCELDSGLRMHIHLGDFYHFAIKSDKDLKSFSDKFEEWEGLTNELVELDYNFIGVFNKYIQQFTDEELKDFTFKL